MLIHSILHLPPASIYRSKYADPGRALDLCASSLAPTGKVGLPNSTHASSLGHTGAAEGPLAAHEPAPRLIKLGGLCCGGFPGRTLTRTEGAETLRNGSSPSIAIQLVGVAPQGRGDARLSSPSDRGLALASPSLWGLWASSSILSRATGSGV